jgi:rhodanese-related sulfurtransferase
MLRKSIILCLGCLLCSQLAMAGEVHKLEARQADRLLQQDTALFLLDVRTLQEYQQVRLAGARLIPIDQLQARENEVPTDRPILVYCAVGIRSSKAAD